MILASQMRVSAKPSYSRRFSRGGVSSLKDILAISSPHNESDFIRHYDHLRRSKPEASRYANIREDARDPSHKSHSSGTDRLHSSGSSITMWSLLYPDSYMIRDYCMWRANEWQVDAYDRRMNPASHVLRHHARSRMFMIS
jgi:hypothetical protein